jgi:mRNA interferase MazF
MHPIWLAHLDKMRPVLVLTREEVRAVRRLVTVAPITSTIRGLQSEVLVGRRNGLDHDSVVNLDSITTIARDALVRPIGTLLAAQERDLTRAFHETFDLEG